MQNLPIHDVINEIQNTLASHDRVVLQAPPGAGKTTAVPIALLDQSWLANRQIIVLEPRRIAARNAAARMAFLLNEDVGQTVGYQIRQDKCFSDKTRILVLTEGILTRKLQADPELKQTALVIFDEFHERSLNADLSLALCLQSQQILRDDLKVLVMSATLNTQAISTLLSENSSEQSPIIQSEGRSFPIDIQYIDKSANRSNISQSKQVELLASLLNTSKQVINKHLGNCLIFLPGVKEISLLSQQIESYLKSENINNILISPLHGNLSKSQQDQAIQAPAEGFRKIVLSTNIAETSLTIEGISCVIDSGLERVLDYQPASAMNGLKTQFISQDSAEQRAGRAGRLSAGTCYRLWTEQEQKRLVKHSVAEILHSDLSSLVLELSNWGVQDINELQWMDVPAESSITEAKNLLKQLNAIDSHGKITVHGQHMLKLGTHPRLAHMMLSALDLDQAYHACLIASLLNEKDIFLPGTDKSFDIHERLTVLNSQKSNPENSNNLHGINKQQCRLIIKSADDFLKRLKQCLTSGKLKQTLKSNSMDNNLSGVLLAFAYPDRIAQQRQTDEPAYLLSNGKGASIPAHLQHHLYSYIVIANLDAKQGEARIYLAAEINTSQIEQFCSHNIQQLRQVKWNTLAQRVEVIQATRIGKINLHEKLITPEDKQAVHACLLDAIKNTGLECLNWSEKAINLRQRVQFINRQKKEKPVLKQKFIHTPLPDLSDSTLLDSLNDWLLPHLNHENSFKQCQKLDIYTLLFSQISWDQQQLIDKLAPEKISVPSGSNIRVDYSDPLQPVLAVRLQEVFGLYDTPTLLDGQFKLMLHLLSPARQPMQVTQDLHSFWQTTYHDVKKELRGKYKRHFWPDDPFTAQATSKTKKNMNRQ